ncbi:MAG: ABC transporter ATP-binding protein [Nanoarchaeota archaeon]|nr:ABC transporter ATP-binding protein [Nanoarchaeota archaeon]
MNPIIKTENLSVIYNLGKTSEIWPLNNINFEIYPQEYVIFFGPSGCGKSTLLYTIAGLEFPTKGRIIVENRDLKHLSQKELTQFHLSSVGMIFQAYYLIPNLSTKNNILLPQIFSKESSEKRQARVQFLMEKFDILNFQKRKPNQLSGGQQQRVAIARALINNPSIVLADEPVGNLDSKNAEIVLNLLSDLNQKDKKTIIHVTHDPTHLFLANRVFYMKDSKITKIIINPEKPFSSFVEKKNISELERLTQAYPYLTELKLRAKMILNHLLFSFGIEEQQKIEEAIEKYLSKKIDEKELIETLDKPPISLYTQTAQNLSQKIIKLAQEIETIELEKYPEITPLEEKAKVLRGYLLDNYSGNLNFEQIQRIEKVLFQRLAGTINKKELQGLFDMPFKKDGVGLNRRTAQKFVREVEIVLMKK